MNIEFPAVVFTRHPVASIYYDEPAWWVISEEGAYGPHVRQVDAQAEAEERFNRTCERMDYLAQRDEG